MVLLLIGYKLKNSSPPDFMVVGTLNTSCDLRKETCWSDLPTSGKVGFSISPKSIPILTSLELTISTESMKVSTVEVDFVGIDMDMGYNHTKLGKFDSNLFKGSAVIPICVRAKMEWEARILLQTDTGLVMAPFRFHTLK